MNPLRARVFRFRLPAETGRGESPPDRGLAARRFGTLLELRDADGRSGWGEASPLSGYAPETPAHAAAALLAWLADPAAGRAIESEYSTWPVDFGGIRLEHSPSARAAIVSAVLDLAGRRDGVPIRDLLWTGAPVEFADPEQWAGIPANGSVPLNALVPLRDPDTAVQAAVAADRRGIRTIKAKLGAGPQFDTDLEVLRAVRETVGPGMAIRLDANGAWSLAEARRNLDQLAELAPEYVEEPVAGLELLELGGVGVPLAADESLHDPDVAERLLDSAVVSVVVLKPSLLGGLDRCMDLVIRATEGGKRSVVTHSFEGPVGHGAACELGLAIAGAAAGPEDAAETAVGLDRHAGLEAWKDVDVPQLSGSTLVPADVWGHGIDPTPLLERSGADGSI